MDRNTPDGFIWSSMAHHTPIWLTYQAKRRLPGHVMTR